MECATSFNLQNFLFSSTICNFMLTSFAEIATVSDGKESKRYSNSLSFSPSNQSVDSSKIPFELSSLDSH